MTATSVTVPTVWLVLPLAAVLFTVWFILCGWLMAKYLDPLVYRFIRWQARRAGLTEEQIENALREAKELMR